MSPRLRCALLFALLALQPILVSAQTHDPVPPRLHPYNGGSVADTFHALFYEVCGHPVPDSRRPPEIVRRPPQSTANTVEEITITHFVEPSICPGVPLPGFLISTFEIGHLQKGTTAVFHRLVPLDANGQPAETPIETRVELVYVGDTPNIAVSGTWFDPATAGTGVSLSLSGDAAGIMTGVLFLATLDAAGAPLWLTGAGQFEDAVLTVPLTRSGLAGDGSIASESVGHATFEYLGCGTARLSVDGVEVRFPDSEGSPLQQLTGTTGVPSCLPPEPGILH